MNSCHYTLIALLNILFSPFCGNARLHHCHWRYRTAPNIFVCEMVASLKNSQQVAKKQGELHAGGLQAVRPACKDVL
ncbi:hypothetical protein BDW02DRAFT_39271 [Decorospora gaudefroyi]|uniref:Secreted protein n=1 Tax=Decorospora gaudefroyi TaxID=184978 RepID=A0A6A5K267_9PLEO|nr:hypothetical protein BDW02DRAFT_39271 [Decorospora gaudefroyi]